MIASFEIATCIAAITAALTIAAMEYAEFRKHRRHSLALRRGLCNLATR
jgi:hypothetical protein